LFRLAVLLLLFGFAASSLAQTPVTLQLKWRHGFQFAGYYAAEAQGYYRDAGLSVRFAEARPGLDVVRQVVSGKAEFGVGSNGLLITRKEGQPVVALAVIFQHSPQVYIARRESAMQSIHDLVGKRVMIERGAEELLAYLRIERIPVDRLHRVEHSFNPQDLIDGKVDVISAYSSNESFYLDAARLEYTVFTPRSAGIDFYGDNLFTSEGMLEKNPEQVRAFREASLRGWRYAMDHPEEIAALIHARYSSEHPLEFYHFEARQMIPLIRPDLIEIGYMSTDRWQHIADTYSGIGMLPPGFDFSRFLYSPAQSSRLDADLKGLRIYLAWAVALIALVSVMAAYIHHINRRLHRSVVEAQQAAEKLQASEEKYRLLTETMKDVVWTVDTETFDFIYISPSVERLRGYKPEELLATPIEGMFRSEDIELIRSLVRQRIEAFVGGQECFYTDEAELPCKDGGTVWVEMVTTFCRNPRTGRIELHGVSRDISERRASQARIAYMAEHDMLTDLPNRALVTDRLRQALAAARRNLHRVALLYIDLDRFKPVNDIYGHAVGDLLLREAAERMRLCVRESDTVGRFGGDEFVVLLPHVESENDALRVAEKIRHAIGEPFRLGGLTLDVSASIGIAVYPHHGSDDAGLLLHADSAMYDAKHGGRDQVCVFGDSAP